MSFQQLRGDLNYVVQTSTNPAEWSGVRTNPFGLGQLGNLLFPIPADAMERQQFYRLGLSPAGQANP